MARVLILEPDAEVRELIRRVVSRLGHEALAPARPPRRVPADDAVFLEPDWPPGLELARALRAREGKTRFVFESIETASPARAELRPLAYLVKPFGLRELERAIETVLTG